MRKEYLYAGISIFFWSTTATVTKLLLGSLNSMQIMMVSSLFATLFLLIVNIANGNIKKLKSLRMSDFLWIFGLGMLGIFIYHLCLYVGIDMMDASQAFIINYLWPIMTVVFACIILKEKFTLRKIIAIVLSFAGVIAVTANGNILAIGHKTLVGCVYCVVAAVAYGLFSVLDKKKHYDKSLAMMLYYFFTFAVSFVYIVMTKDYFSMSLAETGGMLWSGIFTTATAYTSWAMALERGDTAKISNLAYITPFLSLVWTTLILKEAFNIWSFAGLIVIVAGIFVQMKDKKKVG